MNRSTTIVALASLAPLFSLGVGVYLLWGPAVIYEAAMAGPGGVRTSGGTTSLWSSEGLQVLPGLALPLIIAVIGLVSALVYVRFRRLRLGILLSGALMSAYALVGILSGGLFYVPASVMLLTAWVLSDTARF